MGTRARLKGARRAAREEEIERWKRSSPEAKQNFIAVTDKFHELTADLSESEKHTLLGIMSMGGTLVDEEYEYHLSPELEALKAPLKSAFQAIYSSQKI